MSELQDQMARANQFVLRWSPKDLEWTRDHVRVVAMAILYGEAAGLEAGAAIANESFDRMRKAVSA